MVALPHLLAGVGPAYAACYGLIVALAVLSLTVLAWIGEISLAGVAVMGLGAAAVDVGLAAGAPYPLAVAGALGASVPVSLLLGAFLHLRGVSFAVATLAFTYLVQRTVLQGWLGDRGVFGGVASGALPRPALLSTDEALYYAILASVAAAVAACHHLRRSRVGTSLVALRESEAAFCVLGHRPALYRLGVVAFSGVLAALAGVWFATLQLLVPPAWFSPATALVHFGYAVIGGLGSAGGALVTGLCFGALPRYLDSASEGRIGSTVELAAGLLAIGVLLRIPGGLAEAGRRLWARLERAVG